MQLIAILLIIVSILTLLSGVATFFGATKGDRARSAWFFAAAVFAMVWTAAISLFLIATPEWRHMSIIVNLAYVSAIFISVALLGYVSWRKKAGKIATLIALVMDAVFAACFVKNPGLIYSEIILTSAGNSLVPNFGPFYFAYIGLFCVLMLAVLIALVRRILASKSSQTKNGDRVLLIGFGISGVAALIFNLILPLWTWGLIWIGPLTISATVIAFYCTILHCRALSLKSRWIRILSYIVLITSVAVLYMMVFYIVFVAMFRGSTPSIEVIILNFVMMLFFLLLMPAMSELVIFVRALITGEKLARKNKK